uniref:Uncharacterized protein n=1 Tax=Arundo donax TaxID=35708 RepID=A0A0A9D1J4_ARUDO
MDNCLSWEKNSECKMFKKIALAAISKMWLLDLFFSFCSTVLFTRNRTTFFSTMHIVSKLK